MSVQPPKYVVVVHEPTEDTEKIRKFQTISSAVQSSTFYTGTPGFPFAIFDADIADAVKKLAGSKLKPPTFTAAQAQDAIRKVETEVEIYRSDCQKLCNLPANINLAHEVADSFNMELKLFHGGTKREDHIVPGNEPLTAIYYMKGTGPHQVQISEDGGTTHNDLPPTNGSRGIVNGLSAKKDIWLRNRQILPRGQYSEWSDWKKYTPL